MLGKAFQDKVNATLLSTSALAAAAENQTFAHLEELEAENQTFEGLEQAFEFDGITVPKTGQVLPSPATHAISTVLKAGERMFQTLLVTKTVVHAYRGAQPLFHALFCSQNTV